MYRRPGSNYTRRSKAYLSSFSINHMHKKNPLVVAWWSAAFPGFGQFLNGHYIKGLFLILWEVALNVGAKINVSIMYSFTGNFEIAKDVLNTRLALLYVAVYIFCIWDSYRGAVDLNKLSLLADREKQFILPLRLNSVEINYLDRRNPWAALAWSILFPGLGQAYTQRLIGCFPMMFWWVLLAYFSHLLEAVHYTFIGAFSQATAVLNPQWLLFMPSFYGFAAYEAYVSTVEYNKLFDIEQRKFLRDNYQQTTFEMPV